MKVFLSWSGEKSHKVALTLRDWLPSVIQSIIPYVSSEDIDKGARWSSDIAQELENSTFGILCVTKENLDAAWLNFEAGALSKTMEKSFVCPFLFDIKRSEVKGPVLQFQSTIFDKEDIRKLVQALNTASALNGLAEDKLNKAFDVWYPELEKKLNELASLESSNIQALKEHDNLEAATSTILEEILDLSRTNQKLLRNPDSPLEKDIAIIRDLLQEVRETSRRNIALRPKMNRNRKFHPLMIRELLEVTEIDNGWIGIQIVLSFFKDDFPWIYEAGNILVNELKNSKSHDARHKAFERFRSVLDFTFEHPIMREFFHSDEDMWLIRQELPMLIMRSLERKLI